MEQDTQASSHEAGAQAAGPDPAAQAALAAALAAAAALTACGGGGDGGGGGGDVPVAGTGSLTAFAGTPTARGYQYPRARTDAEAARFLLQAQFSASDAEIAELRAKGYLPWLAGQLDAPPAPTGWAWLQSKPYGSATTDDMVWRQLIASPDAVRQRVALALSEIFVVSVVSVAGTWLHHAMAQYWDMLVAGVGGSYRALLEAVTLNPAMGIYLNTRGNQKENAQGRLPDENYAREVMQLMSIGLYPLDEDGTPRRAPDGTRQDSYTQDDVSNLARVFTGYDLDIAEADKRTFTLPGTSTAIESNAWTTRPMALTAARHSTLEAKFLGASVPAGADGQTALATAMDTLAKHPNVGPFIGRQLIQRLVTSNPSPGYVRRVAAVFADNGAGQRGDLRSVVAAVLLDNEARAPQGLADPSFGRLREPMLRLVQWARSFGVGSAADTWKIGSTSDAATRLGQSPLRSPSVFNFFRPGYVPPSGAIAGAGLVAPEFQIVSETSVGGYLNFMQGALINGFNRQDMVARYAAEQALALDADALVVRLNLVLCAGQLSEATQRLIAGALASPALGPESSDAARRNRVCAALLLVMAAPEYLVQK